VAQLAGNGNAPKSRVSWRHFYAFRFSHLSVKKMRRNGNAPTSRVQLRHFLRLFVYSPGCEADAECVAQLTGNGNAPKRHVSLGAISITFFV
jgi:hypothetical protein